MAAAGADQNRFDTIKAMTQTASNDSGRIDQSAGRAQLTLGPVLYHWAPETWRDFYFRIADEAPIDVVFVGEVVCSKRAPFIAEQIGPVIERLQAAGKEVVLASPILATLERERQAVVELAAGAQLPLEANDIGALPLVQGKAHTIGPFINVYNEATVEWLAGRGASAICLGGELPATALEVLARHALQLGIATEVQVFGRLPLAISARCYHARANGLHKDNCKFICQQDPDGLMVSTLDGDPFLAINGTQVVSDAFVLLADELPQLQGFGISRFRLSPHTVDMVAVAQAYRSALDGVLDPVALGTELTRLIAPFEACNGYYHDQPGAVRRPAAD